MRLDPKDRAIIEATQAGLPLVPQPFTVVAETLGMTEAELLDRLQTLKTEGIIRRIGAAPNHYRLGMTANGMSVWDIADDVVDELGEQIGSLSFVTHCYRRPRALPQWPYNLFAMVHGDNREEVLIKRDRIADLLGNACKASDIPVFDPDPEEDWHAIERQERLNHVSPDRIHAANCKSDAGSRPEKRRTGETGSDLEPDASLQPQMPALAIRFQPMSIFREN